MADLEGTVDFTDGELVGELGASVIGGSSGLWEAGAGENSIKSKAATSADGDNSLAEGSATKASDNQAHAEGWGTTASGINSHAEGSSTKASGAQSHAEGYGSVAYGYNAHAEGDNTVADAHCAHAEGSQTEATGAQAHAEGLKSVASGAQSHAEGGYTHATSHYSHAEGYATTASANVSHAEGNNATASGDNSHAEGSSTTASGVNSHAEGSGTYALSYCSHAEGSSTIARGPAQHVQGKYNVEDANGTYAHIVGGGAGENNRKNIHTIDWNGNAMFAGGLVVGGGTDNQHELMPVVIPIEESNDGSGNKVYSTTIMFADIVNAVQSGRSIVIQTTMDFNGSTITIGRNPVSIEVSGIEAHSVTPGKPPAIGISELTMILEISPRIDQLRLTALKFSYGSTGAHVEQIIYLVPLTT